MAAAPRDGGERTESRAGLTREHRLRLRALLAEYRTELLVACLVVFALGAWVSYGAYADPGTETDRQPEGSWTATGAVSHGSVVTEPNPIVPEGTRLENRPLYYESISPTVDGEFVGGYESRTGENVRVELTVDLVYRAVAPDGTAVYWIERERLESVAESDVAPGEDVTASFAVNVSDVRSTIDDIEADLGASPGETEIVLELERTVDGRIDGQRRSATDGYEIPITGDRGTYRLEDEGSYDETHEEYTTETVPASPGPLRSVGGPVLLLVGLAGAGATAVAAARLPEPTRAERDWLAYREDRSAFDELVSTVELPDAALEGPAATVDSLATLAELGIDLESAVLYDPERDRYVVRDDDLLYVFEPPALEGESGETDSRTEGGDRDDTLEGVSFSDSDRDHERERPVTESDDRAVDSASLPAGKSGPKSESKPPAEPESDVTPEDLLALVDVDPDDRSPPESVERDDERHATRSRSRSESEPDATDRSTE